MQNKFAVIAMIMVIMIGMIGLGAATEDVTVSIGDGEGNVTIPIMVENVTNLGSCNILLEFNESVANVTAVTDGDMDSTVINDNNVDSGWIRVVAYQTGSGVLSGNVTVVNVTFTPVDVCSNATSDLSITVTTLKEATSGGQPIRYNVDNGTYTSVYVGGLNGDASGDGVVDIHDALYIAKSVAEIDGYTITCPAIADVDGNGYVDSNDAMYLAKHIAGIPGFDTLK